ncbi:PREDICTED: uncharacterized protein LOC108567967 [Nicrophorus vespilloides]|uniref:Uncharacterized protein LOC108567967 n=1 Tax=Nicrophorus vespilloides TaxID=110193 RepID=A0ABM1NBS9_NICVS|nr:PREDICTED: uncharacterized protein LOC108567967 [Nicrophorus vespilloides]
MKLLIAICILACVCAKKQESDAKENYFRYMRALNGDEVRSHGSLENIPKPGGFRIYYPAKKVAKRETEDAEVNLPDDEFTKPLQLEELDEDNSTEVESKNDLVINDFIRFKREAKDNLRVNKEERSGKMLLSDSVPEGNREPRGATKEQWIKQPYPVQTTDPDRNYEDSVASASETARAPRVHFVTQRRSESAPPLVYHSYDREGRSREPNNRQLSRDLDRDMEYYPRPARHYNPYRDPYYRRQDYDYQYYEEDKPSKHRRIIYYATLPDLGRSPPNVDLRDRYSYRDRYVTSLPVSVGADKFRAAGNPYSKPRFDESSKSAYPLKVSTDVNVREIKKNPERRIYSDVDRRLGYSLPTNYKEEGYDSRYYQ